MQSTLYEMSDLVEQKVGSRLLGELSITWWYANDNTFLAESEEELKCLLVKVKEESENVGFKLNIQKAKIMASVPLCHGK